MVATGRPLAVILDGLCRLVDKLKACNTKEEFLNAPAAPGLLNRDYRMSPANSVGSPADLDFEGLEPKFTQSRMTIIGFLLCLYSQKDDESKIKTR
jgi:hypothetical protein